MSAIKRFSFFLSRNDLAHGRQMLGGTATKLRNTKTLPVAIVSQVGELVQLKRRCRSRQEFHQRSKSPAQTDQKSQLLEEMPQVLGCP